MPPILQSLSGSLHDWAGATALVVSLLGALVGASSQILAKWATQNRQKQISKEADQNFVVSYTFTHPDDDHKTIKRDTASIGGSPTTERAFGPLGPTSADLAKRQVRFRLEEIIEERERQESLATLSRNTSRFLTFGQYIVGAMLTSSLAQDSFTKTWLGIFGLLVILCSAAKQHFRTEENAQLSDARVRKLRALIRHAQDQIAIFEAKSVKGEDRTDAFIALLNKITSSFNQIDSPDVAYLPVNVPAEEPVDSNSASITPLRK